MTDHNGAFVAWAPHAGRTQGFIDRLGLTPIYVHYLQFRKPVYAPLKYIPQSVSTLHKLYQADPNIVFIMAPPIFAVATVYIYCLSRKVPYVIDCHSGVFESKKWRWSLPLLRFFGRRAAAVIVTNITHRNIVDSWPANSVILSDPPPTIPALSDEGQKFLDEEYVVVINSFSPDEAVGEMLSAAARIPEVKFYVTGNTDRAKADWLANSPVNVTFTGWLPDDQYWYLLKHANALVSLTTNDNTILRGGWEAMYLGQPLFISKTQTLMDYFHSGTVFVKNTPDEIAEGIASGLAIESQLRREMHQLREEKIREWEQDIKKFEQLIGYNFPHSDPHHVFPGQGE